MYNIKYPNRSKKKNSENSHSFIRRYTDMFICIIYLMHKICTQYETIIRIKKNTDITQYILNEARMTCV